VRDLFCSYSQRAIFRDKDTIAARRVAAQERHQEYLKSLEEAKRQAVRESEHMAVRKQMEVRLFVCVCVCVCGVWCVVCMCILIPLPLQTSTCTHHANEQIEAQQRTSLQQAKKAAVDKGAVWGVGHADCALHLLFSPLCPAGVGVY
jgi:hypothetical protein